MATKSSSCERPNDERLLKNRERDSSSTAATVKTPSKKDITSHMPITELDKMNNRKAPLRHRYNEKP
jgi:hypothetical protein